MKLVFTILFSISLIAVCFGQGRQTSLDQLTALKGTAAALELLVLAPSDEDVAAAEGENAHAVRLLPRETYDNSFSTIRGGGSYYSFFFRMHDYGYGSDISLERGRFRAGFVMAELGDIPLSGVSRATKDVSGLANYTPKKLEDVMSDYNLGSTNSLKLDDTSYSLGLKAVVGNTYIVRGISFDYYDVLAAFKVIRQDSDNSLILIWKLIEQYDTPRRNYPLKAGTSDAELLGKAKRWQIDERFRDVQVSVSKSVTTLRGFVDKKNLPYLIQMANSDGAARVINFVSTR